MRQTQSFIILSVDRHDKSEHENMHSRSLFEKYLKDKNIKFTYSLGVYTDKHGFKSNELSYIFDRNDLRRDENAFLRYIFFTYDQESVLFIDSIGRATLEFSNGQREAIGRLKEVNKEIAYSSEAYTYIPETQTYWTV